MIFFDTETTDLLKPDATHLKLQPYITEIYCAKLTDDFDLIDEYETYVKPAVPIPHYITKITGITDETVENAPSFIQVYDYLAGFFLGEEIVVGHNVSFDLGVLWAELARCNLEFHFPWPKNWICTVEKSFPIENRRLTLSNLHTIVTGEPHEGAHRAKADVEATIRCFKWLQEKGLI